MKMATAYLCIYFTWDFDLSIVIRPCVRLYTLHHYIWWIYMMNIFHQRLKTCPFSK